MVREPAATGKSRDHGELMVKMVREPAVAGAFYPGGEAELSRMLDSMLGQAPTAKLPGRILGIVCPHAGYEYSGPTAAYAYKALEGKDIKTVVILGPSHRVGFQGFAVFGGGDYGQANFALVHTPGLLELAVGKEGRLDTVVVTGSWKTPLGSVDIDEDLATQVIKQNSIIQNNWKVHVEERSFKVPAPRLRGHDSSLVSCHGVEHSLEVQVPFLQKVLTDSRIVPIEICQAGYDELKILASALAKTCKNKPVLLVASSDLYHGYSQKECERMDTVTLGLIERNDPKVLYDALAAESASACGGLPIVALMLALKEMGGGQPHVLTRTNSNAVTGAADGGWCVGYGAVVFTAQDGKVAKKAGPAQESDELTKEEQTELLRIARTTVDSVVRKAKIPEFKPLTERLRELRGVFVTLHKHGELRGCIGYIEGVKPLYQAVADNAVASATEDYRFSPVQASELKEIDIEVTVLSPLKRTLDPLNDIVLGKHGIVVSRGNRRGVFLPQVATETGWDKVTYLRQCCAGKAGLSQDAWKEKDCEVYTFTGQVFGEKE